MAPLPQERLVPETTRRADRLMAEAMTIIDTARGDGAHLRLTGGLAVRRYATDLDFMDREFSDIDFVGLSCESGRLRRLFERLGYQENRHVTDATAGGQLQYLARARLAESHAHVLKRPRPLGPANVTTAGDHVDVFLDVMRMDHDIDMRSRLDADAYAISPADILLSKLQIGEPAAKDVHDVIALLKDVPLRETGGGGGIDPALLNRACAKDWGLCHDVTANLDLVVSALAAWPLSEAQRRLVAERATRLRTAIADTEKPLRWRLRARVGTRLPWRRQVEEREGSPRVIESTGAAPKLLSCGDCRHAVQISTRLVDLPAAPLACPRCGGLDLDVRSPDTEEPVAA